MAEALPTRRNAFRPGEDEYQIGPDSTAPSASGGTLQDVEDGAQGIPDSPAEGYYEWQKTEGGKKIPHYLYSEKENLLAFAGLYEFWPDPSVPEDDPHRWLLSCTVLTTTAHDSLGHVHDRAPVIIPPEMFHAWLNPSTTDKTAVQEILDAIPEPVLTPRVVTDRVNSVRNNGPELLQPATS